VNLKARNLEQVLERRVKTKVDAKREKHPTQCQRLLEYLLNRKQINPLDAWTKLGIYRLSARINDLKKMGYGITSTRIDVVNAFGGKCSVGLYEFTSVPEGTVSE